MNTTEELIDFKYYIVKRSTPDEFGLRLKNFCQLFRFYSSVILVIVGEYRIILKKNRIDLFIFALGMIGSLLSIKVFSSTKIRRNSSNEYLITSKRKISIKHIVSFILYIVSFVVALLLFNFFCDEVLRSIVNVLHVDLPLNLVDLSRPLCKCKSNIFDLLFKKKEAFAANQKDFSISDIK